MPQAPETMEGLLKSLEAVADTELNIINEGEQIQQRDEGSASRADRLAQLRE